MFDGRWEVNCCESIWTGVGILGGIYGVKKTVHWVDFKIFMHSLLNS